MGKLFNFCCNLYCFLTWFFLLLASGSLIGIIIVSQHQEDGCPKVHSCNYQISSTMNSSLYTYYYVINDQYLCSNFCTNPLDVTSCPVNNSVCDITDEIKDFCKYQGFSHLFNPCYNTTMFWLFILCLWLLLIFIGASGFCFKISYDVSRNSEQSARNYNPEQSARPYIPPVDSRV